MEHDELLAKAIALHKIAYKKPQWNKTKYKDKVFYMLQATFGKKACVIKDLEDHQLLRLIEICEERIQKKQIKMPNGPST